MHTPLLDIDGVIPPLGVVIVDGNSAVRYMNAYMEAKSGVSLSDAQGLSFLSAFPRAQYGTCAPIETAETDTSQNICIANADLCDVEIELDPAAGHNGRLQGLMCFPYLDASGDLLQAILFYEADPKDGNPFQRGFGRKIKDIQEGETETHRLLSELERTNERLLESQKLADIGQLAAGVAHEINNPIGYVFSNLRSLAGYVRDLLTIVDAIDDLEDLDEIRQLKHALDYSYIRSDVGALIEESEEGIGRVKRIIHALQDFSHIDAIGFQPTDLHAAIETTLSVAHAEIQRKAVVVKEYHDAMPDVECDISQIKQVILNLLMNATQAIANTGTITLRTGVQGEDIWFDVEDTGDGMDDAVLARIFEPFFTTKPVGQGTGLGLPLSLTIIEKHHGRMEVFSKVGHGSRIRICLPTTQPASPDPSNGS